MKSALKAKFVLVLFLLICFIPLVSNAQTEKKNRIGIGYWALDYEKENGFEVSNTAYLLLDSIVNDCKAKIQMKTNYTHDEAVSVLSTIGTVIESYNIEYDTLKLFSQALIKRKMDCKFFSITYLTVGENLSLQLFSMIAPEHVFIYWKDLKNKIYWETTNMEEYSEQHFIDSFNISKISINNCAFLNPINYLKSKFIVFSYLGVANSNLGNKQGAIADYNNAIEINPKYTEAYFNRGNAKSTLGDNQEAIADYNKAIEINPQYAEAYFNRGNLKSTLGDKQEAIADYNKVIEINPKDAKAYTNRGVTKSDLGDKQGAIADYNNAIEINPKFAEAYCNRGNAKSALGDKQGAIADYNKAIEIRPKYAIAYYNRGAIKSDLGDMQGAIADYNKAIEINPMDASAYCNRGATKCDLGDMQGAIADYNKAIEISP
ncbi:MAG: tetratricopeptide repeat protein, partial [Bacteroidota bacterium]